MYKLGIDVGGTNVDLAIVDQYDNLLFGTKQIISSTLEEAIEQGIRKLMADQAVSPQDVVSINMGTTLALNSLLELKSLTKVGVIRLANFPIDLPVGYDWPRAHQEGIIAGCVQVAGGREYNNFQSHAVDELAVRRAVDELIQQGAQAFAVCGVFSPFYANDECRVLAIIQTYRPDLLVTLSSQVGNIGFIERENAAILNATLQNTMAMGFGSLTARLQEMGFVCQCHVTQNNGTLMTLDEAITFPVKTISSGPTNSIVGACHLTGLSDAVVVDIGGTSTDIGVIKNKFPIYSLCGASIAGMKCQLLMPDISSIAMAGGSVIRQSVDGFQMGPDSLGGRLLQDCKSNGGDVLTMYDVGRVLQSGDESYITLLDAEKIMRDYLQSVMLEVDRIAPNLREQSIVLVGGGVANIPPHVLDKRFVVPRNFAIANAYGAAISEMAGQVDQIVELGSDKDGMLLTLENQAREQAIQRGANVETLRVVEKQVLPLHYMPEPRHRVMITVAGRV